MFHRTGRPLSAVMDPVVLDDDVAARAQLCPVDPSGEDAVAKGPTWIGHIQEFCDPNHRLKILTKPLYAAGTNTKTIAYVKKTLGYALKQGAGDDLEKMKRRIECAKNHMCGNHRECDFFSQGTATRCTRRKAASTGPHSHMGNTLQTDFPPPWRARGRR